VKGTAAFKATQIAQLGGDQRSGDWSDARDRFYGVFHARKEFLNVGVKLAELLFEELQLCDHRAHEQIESRILAATSEAFLCRVSERLGYLFTE
jgi:hypothetical protein